MEAAAEALKAVMTGTLDEHAKKKRWCSRSKPWWTAEIKELRKDLGHTRRDKGASSMERQQEARRVLRRTIRREKRECWDRFLQGAKGKDVWTAAGYTAPRIDKAGQSLVGEDGSVAEGRHDWEQAMLRAHFPQGPAGSFEPQEGGRAFEKVNAQLVGQMLGKAANTSAPGDDRITADIVKVFWQWDKQRITQLRGSKKHVHSREASAGHLYTSVRAPPVTVYCDCPM